MTAGPHPPFEFGYFPRNKYKDLVFYVKNPGEHTLYGLFEMEDNEENRAIMDALIPHTPTKSEQEIRLLSELEEWCCKERDNAEEEGDYVVEAIFCDVLGKIAELRSKQGGP